MNRLVKVLLLVVAISGALAEKLPEGDPKELRQWLLDNYPSLAETCSYTDEKRYGQKLSLLRRLSTISEKLAEACYQFENIN